jgi:hypothetical protein
MIKSIPSFLDHNQIEYFLSLFKDSTCNLHEDNVYKFYYVDLIQKKMPFETFKNFHFKKFRIQMVDETIMQIETTHRHVNPWSFIIFLNDNFIGGEVVFDNVLYKPKTSDMIYFSGEEQHKVNDCIGKRYTLVGFMNNNPLSIKKISLI